MSRGFVREGDQEEHPVIPERAPLPQGTVNYVTPEGFLLLQQELDELEAQISAASTAAEAERRRLTMILEVQISRLKERIRTAQVLDLSAENPEEIRFGAAVTFRYAGTKAIQRIKITGVDEANFREGKISFVSPLAKALTGGRAGETVEVSLPAGRKRIEVMQVRYGR